jgi:hypothetical protein
MRSIVNICGERSPRVPACSRRPSLAGDKPVPGVEARPTLDGLPGARIRSLVQPTGMAALRLEGKTS